MTNTRYIGKESSINVHDQLSPYMGYKVVGVMNPEKDKPLKFFGPHFSKNDFQYENMQQSYCAKSCKDFEKCSCGFYAYESYKQTFSHWVHEVGAIHSFFIAQIAFSGTTVICENGARGKIQRIVKLFIPCCWNCNGTATNFIKHVGGSLVPACFDCTETLGGVENASFVSFSDLSKMLSVEGFKPVEIIPAAMGKLQQALSNDDLCNEVMIAIRGLIQDGETEMLSKIGNAAFDGSVKMNLVGE